MKTADAVPRSIDDCIAAFPPEIRAILDKIRATARRAAPESEKISYRMPAFVQHGILVYFVAFKKHIGLYPQVRNAKHQGRSVGVCAREG